MLKHILVSMIYFLNIFNCFYSFCLHVKYRTLRNSNNGNLYLRLRTMSHTIYAAKFRQTIIHQHVHLGCESQSHAPAHVLMRLFPIDKSLVCLQSERRITDILLNVALNTITLIPSIPSFLNSFYFIINIAEILLAGR
jgi:hypothetical protein